MNSTRKTLNYEGGQSANTVPQSAIKESKTKITAAKLIRWSGLSAMAAGIIFAGIHINAFDQIPIFN